MYLIVHKAFQFTGISVSGALHASAKWTHWGGLRISASVNCDIIGWDNGLSPVRHQDIIWTTSDFLLGAPSDTDLD